MKSLLVVEDEKMIRQGIVTMVKRSPVEIGEILECRNGEEALAILRSRPVEVMFTDIRMPKMDGITLIGQLHELACPPKTIVVSGYDDFSYAVEALRGGVQDYLLKPIEREKVYAILEKLEAQLKEEEKKQEEGRRLGLRELRYLIVNRETLPEDELRELEQRFMSGRYRIIVCPDSLGKASGGILELGEIDGQSVFIAEEKAAERLEEGTYAGISKSHEGIRGLKDGYTEALEARRFAFIAGKQIWAEQLEDTEKTELPEQFAEQFVQLFGTDKVQSGLNRLENYYFRAKRENLDRKQLLDTTVIVLEQILVTYRNVLEMDMTGYLKLKQPLSYPEAAAFLEEFRAWAMRTNELIMSEFSDYRNKGKISQAVAYIRENYDKELNMAVVSNHVSMNYSLFSLSFKQYTGMNFVNYLKMIRIGEAKRLLEETDEKIIDISQKVGYENEKHFMKTFKSVCGVSPSEYRKNMQMGK